MRATDMIRSVLDMIDSLDDREPKIDMWYITFEWVYAQLLSRNVSNVVCQRWWKEDSNVCLNYILMLLIHITFWHANISSFCYYSFTFNFDFFTTKGMRVIWLLWSWMFVLIITSTGIIVYWLKWHLCCIITCCLRLQWYYVVKNPLIREQVIRNTTLKLHWNIKYCNSPVYFG